LASGADLKAIQDMLGHASIVLTADTYTSELHENLLSTVLWATRKDFRTWKPPAARATV